MDQTLKIYKASAGSGKTFRLAVEYISALMQAGAEHAFDRTLAVTFTNKATAEMKGRILETLYGLAHGLDEAQPYLEAIQKRKASPLTPPSWEEPATKKPPRKGGGMAGAPTSDGEGLEEPFIRAQAGKVLAAILHDYSHFRVETIDSFFQSILRGMARELGLAASLRVELSHDEIVDSAVDSLIERMDEQPEVSKWVLNYVREQLDSGDKWDIVKPLKAFAQNIFREEYQRRSKEELERISNADVIRAFKSKMNALRSKAVQDVQEAADELLRALPDPGSITYGNNVLSFIAKARSMNSDGASKSVLGTKYKSKNAKSNEPDPRTLALQGQLAEFDGFYKERRRLYLSASLALRHLDLLRLLVYIDERAHEIEGDSGRFTLSSTPALLAAMVEGSDAPFIFEKTATFVDNVMIDEFQDTSRMQWENFKKLIFEKLASGGKGLLVGDIKQSIYRWRGGDWKILYGLEHEPELQRFDMQPEPLDTNYRSHQVIVDFVADFFPKAAQRLDAVKPDADIKLTHIYDNVKQKPKKQDGLGYVRVRLQKAKSDEARAKNQSNTAEAQSNSDSSSQTLHSSLADMASQIRLLHAGGLDYSEIAILVRTNIMARQLIEEFSQIAPEIRFVSDEAFLLSASVSVRMLVAALHVLIDKGHSDRISETYLMLHYAKDVLGKDVNIQSIATLKAEDVLPEAFTAHRSELLGLPLYLLAERLWRIFSLEAIKGEDIYMLTFLDELQNHLRSAASPDIQTFLEAWDERISACSVPGSAVAGVRILTIHKSKGLEFHTVMLPFSHWKMESDRQGDMLWCATTEKPFDELGALPIPSYAKDVRSSVFAPNYEEEHLERRVDALNTLYVAFTRAGSNLYVWGDTKPADKIQNLTTAAELIYLTLREKGDDTTTDAFTFEVGSPITTAKKKDQEQDNRLRVSHREEDAIDVKVVTRNPDLNFRQSNQAQEYLGLMKDGTLSQREVGTRMHEVLSRISDVSQLDEVLARARRDGLIGESEEWEGIVDNIRAGLRDPLVASWFSTTGVVYNECSIASVDKDGQPCVLRPDRVVVDDDCITVVDYKFGHPLPTYYKQIADYMRLLRQMYPTIKVKGYIWYVMGKGDEEVVPASHQGNSNNRKHTS